MKFLLFFVSVIFSAIFFVFYGLSIGKDIFGKDISNSFTLDSFSGNLLIESFIFILISVFFLFIFSNTKNGGNSNLVNYKIEILYFIYYILFISYIYFYNSSLDYYTISIFVIFIVSDVLFNHVSNIKKLSNYKVNIRYAGLILNYISTFCILLYISIYNSLLILYLILIFNILFNIYVHSKYTNYISLLLVVIIVLFSFYHLYFLLLELYILYI